MNAATQASRPTRRPAYNSRHILSSLDEDEAAIIKASLIRKDFSTMNSADLAAKLAEQNSLSKDQAKSILDEVFKEIIAAASSGVEIALAGFGKFKVKESAAREGRNPSTGEVIKIVASKKLSFTPAKAVKDRLNEA